MTPKRAVTIGTCLVNIPVMGIMVFGFLVSRRFGNLWFVLICWVLSIAIAWLYWSITVPRWRLWALRAGADADETQKLAVRAGLVWPRGSFFEKTELPPRKNHDQSI